MSDAAIYLTASPSAPRTLPEAVDCFYDTLYEVLKGEFILRVDVLQTLLPKLGVVRGVGRRAGAHRPHPAVGVERAGQCGVAQRTEQRRLRAANRRLSGLTRK